MDHVTRVHRALRREATDCHPIFMSATPQFLQRAVHTGPAGPTPVQAWEYCVKLGLDVVQVAHPSFHPNCVLEFPLGHKYEDEWDRHHVISEYYDEFCAPFPLLPDSRLDLPTLRAKWADYELPNPLDPNWFAPIDAIVARNQVLPNPLSVWGVINGPLEPTWQLLSDGWPAFFILARRDWDLANAIMARVTDYCIAAGQAMIDHGADVIRIGDDYALNERLMTSPEIWRELIFPHHCRLVRGLKQRGGHDFPVILHSDGNITPILADVAKGGITALNPIQPGALDFAAVLHEVGDKLALTGAFDLRLFLQPCTPAAKAELEVEIKRLLDLVNAFNTSHVRTGFCIGPSHQVQPASDVATFETWVALVQQNNACPGSAKKEKQA